MDGVGKSVHGITARLGVIGTKTCSFTHNPCVFRSRMAKKKKPKGVTFVLRPTCGRLVATADAERARELCESLREGVTVLDEPFHIEALAQSMLDAADLLERLTAPVASPASPEGE